VATSRGAAHSWIGGISNMVNDRKVNKYIEVERFQRLKSDLNIADDRARHDIAGIVLQNTEEMDIGV